jgi:hypothetical protein
MWKRDIFCKVKEIKGLCGGKHSFAAQANLQIDAEIAEISVSGQKLSKAVLQTR